MGRTKKTQRRTLIHTRIVYVPDGCALDHVPDGETLDCLVLSYCTSAIGAAHELDMATAFLVAAAISSFLGLKVERVSTRGPICMSSGMSLCHPTT
jgi:hypothetical protein